MSVHDIFNAKHSQAQAATARKEIYIVCVCVCCLCCVYILYISMCWRAENLHALEPLVIMYASNMHPRARECGDNSAAPPQRNDLLADYRRTSSKAAAPAPAAKHVEKTFIASVLRAVAVCVGNWARNKLRSACASFFFAEHGSEIAAHSECSQQWQPRTARI